jgi:hypothetical protein
MKEKIYTIPVNEAFDEGGECPFCNMYRRLESESVDYMLGPAYMEDDIRMETNRKGFCAHHYSLMYKQQNRLGLALMLHTHVQTVGKELNALAANRKPTKKSLFAKPKTSKEGNPIVAYLNEVSSTCYICDRVEHTFDRYIDTFFYMWAKMPEIRDKVASSQGFCLKHFAMLTDKGEKSLSSADYEKLMDIILPLEQENIKRITDEVEHFTDKFDYRHKDEPWGNSRDSVERGILKTSSHFTEE